MINIIEEHETKNGFSIKLFRPYVKDYLHWHDYYEVLLMVSGEETIRIGNTNIVLKPGDIFFLRPYEIHRAFVDRSQTGVLYTMHYSDEFINNNNKTSFHSKYLNLFLSRYQNDVFCHIKSVDQSVFNIFEELNRAYNECDPIDEYRVKGYLFLLLAYLNEQNAPLIAMQDCSTYTECDFDVDEVCFFLENHCGDIPLQKIADQFGYSRSYFSSKFKSAVGHTYKEYLTFVRMHEAIKMIDDGMSVTETALRLGYSNPGNFSRAFLKYTGTIPSSNKK